MSVHGYTWQFCPQFSCHREKSNNLRILPVRSGENDGLYQKLIMPRARAELGMVGIKIVTEVDVKRVVELALVPQVRRPGEAARRMGGAAVVVHAADRGKRDVPAPFVLLRHEAVVGLGPDLQRF